MRGRRSALLLSIVLAVAPVILAQRPSSPAFVVPTFADLTIKKRHSFGSRSSRSATEVLYLKGARERREFLDQSGNTWPGHVTIMQCDQRRSVQLNPDAKLYSVSVVEGTGPSSSSVAVRWPKGRRTSSAKPSFFDHVEPLPLWRCARVPVIDRL